MPNHPVGRDFAEGHYHNLEYVTWLDEVGYEEAWVGCHYTVPREPNPAPDLLVAQALTQTKNIRISPGGYMLPYHHPAELAHRIAWLDHISKGRCYLGIGSGSIPSDWALFNIDGFGGENLGWRRAGGGLGLWRCHASPLVVALDAMVSSGSGGVHVTPCRSIAAS